jgi:hypothetical protein
MMVPNPKLRDQEVLIGTDNFSSAVSEGVDELHMVSDDPSGGAVSA